MDYAALLTMIEHLRQILADPFIAKTLVYLTTLFGATAMHVFSLNKGFEGSVRFLERILPNRSEAFYYRLDFLIVTISGSIIGTIFFSPTSHYQALAAGLGWVGAARILTAPDQHKVETGGE